VCLAGCASAQTTAMQKDVSDLRKELVAQRQIQEDLRVRLARLETRADAQSAPPVVAAPAAAMPASRDVTPLASVQALPVVRLAPPDPAPAPAVDTSVPLHETSRFHVYDHSVSDSDAPVDLGAVIARQSQRDSLKEASPAESRDAEADAEFQKAVTKYNAGKYTDAAQQFRSFATRHPTHASAADALYLAGMSQVAVNHCLEARPLFQTAIDDYPHDGAARRSMLALGQCEATVGHDESARTIFKRVMTEHPKSAEASQAEAALAELSVAHSP
jgi:tol-pal system protein YbgF